MPTISPVEIFIALFIGMGPIKVLLVYIAMTESMSQEVRRQVARRTVMVAGVVALGLFLVGAILQAILHFSIGSLTIFGGLILLILALTMVMGSQQSSGSEHGDPDPMSIAVSPLAIPLTLNPVGIVILVVASVEVTDLGRALMIIAMYQNTLSNRRSVPNEEEAVKSVFGNGDAVGGSPSCGRRAPAAGRRGRLRRRR